MRMYERHFCRDARQRRANINGPTGPNRDKNVTPTQPAQPLRFSRPIRFSPQLKTAGRPVRTDRARIVAHDAPYDPWSLAAVFSKVQLKRGPERFVRRPFSLHWGAG